MYPVNIANKAEILMGKVMAVSYDNDAHDITIEKIIRGFLFRQKILILIYKIFDKPGHAILSILGRSRVIHFIRNNFYCVL